MRDRTRHTRRPNPLAAIAMFPDRPDTADRPPPTVLVVEDDPAVRQLAATVLRLAGCDVLGAGTVAEARNLLDRHPGPIAVVVTDLALPDGSGVELSAAAAALRPGIRVLVISGWPAAAADLPHGVAFLDKPFTASALRETVWALMVEP